MEDLENSYDEKMNGLDTKSTELTKAFNENHQRPHFM